MERIVVGLHEGVPRVSVQRDDGDGDVELPALWLRQYSPESTQCDAVTGQRLFDPHYLPSDLHLVEVSATDGQIHVTFSDGHRSMFEEAVLLSNIRLSEGVPEPVLWQAGSGHPRQHVWPTLNNPESELAALGDFITYGCIVLTEVPCIPDTLREVAQRFGFVRDTNFGPVFDVRSSPNSTDLAYRSVPLSPHTDNPYRTPVPGIQMLHCLINETNGGFSTLVDGFSAIDQLQATNPDAVDLLANVSVRFRYRDDSTDIVTVRPVLERDYGGTIVGLSYSPRLDELPLLPAAQTRRYHEARQALAQLLASPQLEERFALQAGQLMMFDNNRVLHGRTAFDPNEGMRHLQGCYIDRDGPRTRWRVLSRQLATVNSRRLPN
jgi:gamma-butyrobetaine dioxygenase